MKPIFGLGRLPELQHLEESARSRALREWRRQLPLSFHVQEIAIRSAVMFSFILIRFVAFKAPLRWYDAFWLFAGYMLGYIISAHVLYMKKRDVLTAILRRAEFAP